MRNNLESKLKLTGADVKLWKEFRPIINYETKRYLEMFFGDSLRLFWKEIHEDKNLSYQNLIEPFFSLAFDKEMRQRVVLSLPTGKIVEAPPVYILTRAAGIDWFKKEIGFKEDEILLSQPSNFFILRLDVADIYEANQVDYGIGGNYLLNQVAAGINEFADEILNEINTENKIMPIRYGGDEFVVLITGSLSDRQKNTIIEKIKYLIYSKKAFFGKEGIERQISFKNDELEVIDPNQIFDERKKKLFNFFLSRGFIISLDELENEFHYIETKEDGVEQFLEKQMAKKIFFRHEIGLDMKFELLLEKHPEFKVPLYLARYLDGKEHTDLRQKNLIYFLENILTDPILEENIITRYDLVDHLLRENLTDVLLFEIKLKEIDEHPSFGFIYGDNLIKILWNKIKQELTSSVEDFEDKFLIGRFGGTIFIGIRNNFNLNEEDLQKLKNLSIKYRNVTHTVGFAAISLSNISMTNIGENETNKNKLLMEIFESTTDDWLYKKAEYLSSDDYLRNIFIEKLSKKLIEIRQEEISNDDTRINLELLLRYFLGKRGLIRRQKMIELIKNMSDIRQKKLSSLISVLNNYDEI
jgi:GGDEF domain-containing protein